MPGCVTWCGGPLSAGGCEADGWDNDPLTENELARLAAWDGAGDLSDEPDQDGEDQWPAGLPPGLAGDPAAAGDPAGPDVLAVAVDPEDPDIPASTGEPACPDVLMTLTPRRWGTGGGFDAGGVTDRIPPGPLLAGLAAREHDTRLTRIGDDEVAGLVIAWRRLASWATAGELAAVTELDRRRRAAVAAGADPHLAEHLSDEIAMVLTLTARAADKRTELARALAALPLTAAALRGGDIDVPKALVIIGEVAGLDGPHAARVEAVVIGAAGEQTTGQLRRSVRQAVIAADPDAAQTRKQNARKEARVECWPEQAGTAALAGRDLPTADTLAADQRISAYARQLKRAGANGTLDQLRAKVYLALLNGQAVESLLPTGTEDAATPAAGLSGHASAAGRDRADAQRPADGSVAAMGPVACGSVNPGLPTVRGSVNLVLPLATWLGWSQSPGEVAGYGPTDAADSQVLAAALARDPTTTWCVTVTGADGRAIAHGCATASPGQPPQQLPRQPSRQGDRPGSGAGPPPVGRPPGQGPPVAEDRCPGIQSTRPGEGRSPGDQATGPGENPHLPGPPGGIGSWLTGIDLAWLETEVCNHQRQTPGYRPTRSLAHLVQIRQRTCTAPGCRRPATACDFEHTIPWHHGGRTCECNAGPCCRRHHRAKQAAGWQLSQPQPGVFAWQPPHGRTYTTHPGPYPT